MTKATARAVATTAIFAFFGLFSAFFLVRDWSVSWAPFMIYCILVFNAFFSVKHFSAIVSPRLPLQIVLDTVLVLLHALLALLFGAPLLFGLGIAGLFAVATLKYATPLESISESRLLYRKIRVDALGAVGALVGVAVGIAGYPVQGIAGFATVFLIATVYIVSLNPLYELPSS